MINKVIKLKLQYFKHVYVQATCQRDSEVYATCHDPKIYPHTKFGIPTSNYIQICSGLDLARTETRGQGLSVLEPVGDSPGHKMYLHTKYGTATINNIPEINVTEAENSERSPTYIHKLNLGVNMSYNMRHALNTVICLLLVSCLFGELF